MEIIMNIKIGKIKFIKIRENKLKILYSYYHSRKTNIRNEERRFIEKKSQTKKKYYQHETIHTLSFLICHCYGCGSQER